MNAVWFGLIVAAAGAVAYIIGWTVGYGAGYTEAVRRCFSQDTRGGEKEGGERG